MEFTVSPPPTILFVAVGIFIVLLFSSLRGRGSRLVRMVRLGVGSAVIIVMLALAYRPSSIRVDDRGISSSSAGGVSIGWNTVTNAAYVSPLTSSSYAPRAKIHGVALGSYRVGSFKTAGGHDAVVIAAYSADALVIHASGRIYEFTPEHLPEMVQAVTRHVPVAGWHPAVNGS